jgi:hypothetical protein
MTRGSRLLGWDGTKLEGRVRSAIMLCSSKAFTRLRSAAFLLSRLDRVRASLLPISSLDSLPDGSAAGSPYEEPASLLAPSSSGLSRNVAVAVSAGVPAATSLLAMCIPVEGPALVVSRRKGFLEDTMIVNRA